MGEGAPKQENSPQVTVNMRLLQAEKRIVDLEMVVSQLQEMKNQIDSIQTAVQQQPQAPQLPPDLTQRIDDLEDAVMVENLGIEEVKKMMSEVKENMNAQQAAPAIPSEEIGQLAQKIERIKDAVMEIQSRPQPNEDMTAFKNWIEAKVTDLEKKIAVLSVVEGAPSQIADRDLENYKRDVSVVSMRIDSLETVTKGLSESMIKVESALKKFDTFERAASLSKVMEAKIEEFKFIESEIRRISNRVETMYSNIDQRLDKITDLDRKSGEIMQAVDKLGAEIDKTKIIVLDRAEKSRVVEMERKINENRLMMEERIRKDELTNVIKEVERSHAEILKKIKQMETTDVNKTIDQIKSDMAKRLGEVKDPIAMMNMQMSELVNKLVALEIRLNGLEKMAEERVQPVILE